MVDEKMLMGIKNALDKVDSYKNRKDIESYAIVEHMKTISKLSISSKKS